MTAQLNGAAAPGSAFSRGLRVQANVIGALLMRELHTRYGRDNIGYLWMVLEPLLFASVISSIRLAEGVTQFGSDIRPFPFTVCGYGVFIIFRAIVSRSEGVIEANAPLLYHRMVTLLDMIFARTLLEAAGVTTTIVLLLSVATVLGLGHPPVRPLSMMAGVALMIWMSFAVSMSVCAFTHENHTLGRLVHTWLYFMIPLSGGFFTLQWLPLEVRNVLVWSPMVQIFELVRYGEFNSAKDTYVNLVYIIGWCMALTYIGLISLRMVRSRIHLH